MKRYLMLLLSIAFMSGQSWAATSGNKLHITNNLSSKHMTISAVYWYNCKKSSKPMDLRCKHKFTAKVGVGKTLKVNQDESGYRYYAVNVSDEIQLRSHLIYLPPKHSWEIICQGTSDNMTCAKRRIR